MGENYFFDLKNQYQLTKLITLFLDNTRIAVADILNLLKAGYTIDEIPNQYQGVTKAGTISAIEYAVNILGKEETLSISR